jgi:hypothetical protein
MTVIVQPERWLFGGVDLSTFATAVESVVGSGEFPQVRGSDVPMASVDGARWTQKLFDARRIALNLFLGSSIADGTGAGSPTQAELNLEALQVVLAVRKAQQQLIQVMPDGSQRIAMAECVDFQKITWQAGREAADAVADFQLADPWFYTANVVDSARDVSASPTSFNFTHPGTVRGNQVMFDILGPAVNPQILNNTNGVSVQCLVTVAATKHLLIDSGAWTALNDGVQAIGSIRHSGAFPFMFFEPGVNALSWTATGLSAASRLTSTLQPPWI